MCFRSFFFCLFCFFSMPFYLNKHRGVSNDCHNAKLKTQGGCLVLVQKMFFSDNRQRFFSDNGPRCFPNCQ